MFGLGPVMTFAVIALLLLLSGAKVLREYERGVVFRLGRLVPHRGPGIIYVIPLIEAWSGSTCAPSLWTSRRRT